MGDRLPSEAILCERFQASRITVAKAIQTLQNQGLVSRRPGSGTYIQAPPVSSSLQFGLLIPELGRTEIFEPICQGMMSSPLGKSHSLIWGYSAETGEEDRESAAEQLCQQYIAQKVAGVFFAPLEYTSSKDVANRRIIAALKQANMPVVLLDRCFETYPARSAYDLVGIDNHRAGYTLTRHLQELGARRILFAARPNSASTVDERIAGYFEALRDRPGYAGRACRLDADDIAEVGSWIEAEKPDAIICANDLTAASLMKTLEILGVSIPQQIRIVGVDDVNYAKFLPVPLTTIRQDCAEIGSVAMSVMLERIQRPTRPPRDILVHFDLIVRQSCGSHTEDAAPRRRRPPATEPGTTLSGVTLETGAHLS
jgi:GntR family transcriptional regulator of arabinose operon